MKCECGSERIARVRVRDCAATFVVRVGNHYVAQGHVPSDLGIGAGPHLKFDYCLDCGRIQGKFPKKG